MSTIKIILYTHTHTQNTDAHMRMRIHSNKLVRTCTSSYTSTHAL